VNPVPTTRASEYIERIKAYRARTGATLHDAKKAVDANRDIRRLPTIGPCSWTCFFVGYGLACIMTVPLKVSPEQALSNFGAWWKAAFG